MIKDLEAALGYRFSNITLLQNALTHSSYANERWHNSLLSNERLEFLGDSVLGMLVAEYLYRNFPDRPEGELTRMRADMVCEQTLADVANSICLGDHLLLGHGEERFGGRCRDSILADAMEAIIGAMFLDGGYEAAEKFVVRVFRDTIDKAVGGKLFSDYKSEVQELLQKKGSSVTITYEIDREEGPAHDKTFFVHLECNGQILGNGSGKSKKEAEQKAAREALERGELNVF